jgi:hypothetical protein
MKIFFTSLLMLSSLLCSFRLCAQDAASAFLSDTKRDLGIVTAAGVGGAVIGLSTLSFVDKPSKNLKNVLIGGAIGIIVGVGIVAYMQATQSSKVYEDASAFVPESSFSTTERVAHFAPSAFADKKQDVNRSKILQLSIPVLSF